MMWLKCIFEVGIYIGYFVFCFVEGFVDDGKLIIIDVNIQLEDFVCGYFDQVNLVEKIDFCVGDVVVIILELEEEFDLVFIDVDKCFYFVYYEMIILKM